MAIPVPALVVDADALDHNIRTIGETLPGSRLRPHVKAFKSTALAQRLADAKNDQHLPMLFYMLDIFLLLLNF